MLVHLRSCEYFSFWRNSLFVLGVWPFKRSHSKHLECPLSLVARGPKWRRPKKFGRPRRERLVSFGFFEFFCYVLCFPQNAFYWFLQRKSWCFSSYFLFSKAFCLIMFYGSCMCFGFSNANPSLDWPQKKGLVWFGVCKLPYIFGGFPILFRVPNFSPIVLTLRA